MFNNKTDRGTITPWDWLAGIVWAIARVWVGWQFLTAGLSKIGAPAWTGATAGAQVRQLLGVAISPKMTGGLHPNTLGPFAWLIRHLFLPNATPLAYLVTTAEILVGLTLVFGVLTRVAAAAGACLNLLYLLSGSIGVNPLMLAIELAIVFAGTDAGLIGLDLLLLPTLRRRLVHTRQQGHTSAGTTMPRQLTRTG